MLGSQNHSVLRRREGCRHKAKPIACKCNNPSYLSAEWDRKTVPERRHAEINCALLNHPGRLLEVTVQQEVGGKILDRTVKIAKNEQTYQQADHRIAVATQPVQVALRAAFTHE